MVEEYNNGKVVGKLRDTLFQVHKGSDPYNKTN
jgi:hypothetical protein